jgi:hypothetical protein
VPLASNADQREAGTPPRWQPGSQDPEENEPDRRIVGPRWGLVAPVGRVARSPDFIQHQDTISARINQLDSLNALFSNWIFGRAFLPQRDYNK